MTEVAFLARWCAVWVTGVASGASARYSTGSGEYNVHCVPLKGQQRSFADSLGRSGIFFRRSSTLKRFRGLQSLPISFHRWRQVGRYAHKMGQ